MNPQQRYYQEYPMDAGEPMHDYRHQPPLAHYDHTPQYNPYSPRPVYPYYRASHAFGTGPQPPFSQQEPWPRDSPQRYPPAPQAAYPRPGPAWDCFHCEFKFYSEAERDQHIAVCPRMHQPAAKEDPFYESIDNPPQLPTVLLVWNKERPTLEKEVHLFTTDADPTPLAWSEPEARFQGRTQLKAGEHDGLLSVSDINLFAKVHSFYVAPYRIGAAMQSVELAIDDEAQELKEQMEQKEQGAVADGAEGKGKPDKPLKAKTSSLKKRLTNAMKPLNPEVAANAEAGEKEPEESKKVKSLQKENGKLAQREAELREQNKRLAEDNAKFRAQNEALEKSWERSREQLEAEKQVLVKTISELKKKVDVVAREREDLSQQKSNLEEIVRVQELRFKDLEEELCERRERTAQLEALQLKFAEQEKLWLQDTENCKLRLREITDRSEIELDQSRKELEKCQIICNSLRREKDRARDSAAARLVEAELALASEGVAVGVAPPPEGPIEEREVQALKIRLEQAEREKSELVLVSQANEIDLESAREQLQLERTQKDPKKQPKGAHDPDISRFFQDTIRRKEEELEEMKGTLAELRGQNLKLGNERDAFQQQLKTCTEQLIPGLRRQVETLRAAQLGAPLSLPSPDSSLVAPAVSSLQELPSSLIETNGPAPDIQSSNEAGKSKKSLPSPINTVPIAGAEPSIPVTRCDWDIVAQNKTSLPSPIHGPATISPALDFRNLPPPKHIQKKISYQASNPQ